MNRNNIFIHIALALVLVLVAAFAGQLNKWRKNWRPARFVPVEEKKKAMTVEDISLSETRSLGAPEILVKFKSGVTQDAIDRLVAERNDRVEDRIENIEGWEAIDDFDNADAATLVKEYQQLPEVEYAEPNYEINLDESEAGPLVPILPSDPQFTDQWALSNSGQRGGKKGADISATLAWAKTTGSDEVVVAVLDTGVDYNHEDLTENMWRRPEKMEPYHDNELGTIDDEFGYNAIDGSDPMDDNGHGTHCAGIIGAEGENNVGIAGVNWKVQIMPLKFMNAGGS
ncbi:MAG TPA: S8 family serine peptidase, partial [Pyrinomonadaceae bacterium]|nr:S8 family serine peptidase [Pyrinomonadaceae bacterium]